MLFSIIVVTYFMIFVFDYNHLKKIQNKKQNVLYLLIFFLSFSLLTAYALELPFPILSDLF